MQLPDDFQYSQASLQDYVDCRRRFYLRYILRLPWPAVENEPTLQQEEHARQGQQFHRMVQQHLIGIPEEHLSRSALQADLMRWWGNYLKHPITDLPSRLLPEFQLSAPAGSSRLLAKFDLLAMEPEGRVVIVDWKTSRKLPRRDWVRDRLQTRVYRYLVVQAGASLQGGRRIAAGDVEMRYWFAEFPEDVLRFPYDDAQYELDDIYFDGLFDEIERLSVEAFKRTDNTDRCRYCRYRSLCERGIEAGEVPEEALFYDDTDLDALDLDLDEILEVRF